MKAFLGKLLKGLARFLFHSLAILMRSKVCKNKKAKRIDSAQGIEGTEYPTEKEN